MFKYIIFIWLTLFSCSLMATEVVVLGLFEGKALLKINSQEKLLTVDQEKDGVKLIQANSDYCIVEMNGQQEKLMLNNEVRTMLAAPSKIIRVEQDNRGTYHVEGRINGKKMDMIIDTGATTIAMSLQQAQNLGISYDITKPVSVQTASGKIKGYQISLNKITVDDITLYDIPAIALEGELSNVVLLGMNFLQRFHIKNEDNYLELRPKY